MYNVATIKKALKYIIETIVQSRFEVFGTELEFDDKGKYKPYFENLKKLLEEIGEEESDIVTLELNKLVINSIENYGRKLKADGIEKEELMNCLEKVNNSTEKIPADTEKTSEMKEYIQKRYKEAVKVVELVYED